MNISGLDENYYLSGNDIWVQVSDFLPKTPVRLELKATNIVTFATMPIFRLYADMNNVFRFNISQVIRPLQPYPNHIIRNSIQTYRLEFTVVFSDDTTEIIVLDRYFIRGCKEKHGNDVWNLENMQPLYISKWVTWRNVILPSFANRIEGANIQDFIPPVIDTYTMIVPSICNGKIIKFLNSLGGYQFWVFETNEIQVKTKSKGVVSQIAMSLREDTVRNIGVEAAKEITLKTKTPADLQSIILDLIQSPEILMYDEAGTDDASKWTRLQIANSNEAILNTNDMSYSNEIDFIIPTYNNRDL